MADDWQNGGFGLYLHWPFCEAKCPYCDFNSHVAKTIDHRRWLTAYLAELDRYAAETSGRVLNSVFFGGGTPSLMSPDTVAGILDHVRRLWPVSNDLEVTLEANPSSVEAGKFAAFRQGGVNRVSLGIQSLKDDDLRRLGRIHTALEGVQAIDIARKTFDRVSFDLIYARQDQTLADWKAELRQALTLAGDHLSLYQLTIEDGTAFGDRYKRGKLRGLPEDDTAADMYFLTQDMCGEAGLEGYETSNHALPGSESRHNLIYWRYGDYIGIGPGAHGRLTIGGQRYATEATRAPALWLDQIDQGGGESVRDPLTLEDQASEFLMMGMRLNQGVDLTRYAALAGQPLASGKMTHLAEIGMIEFDDRTLRTTQDGRSVLNAVLADLLAD